MDNKLDTPSIPNELVIDELKWKYACWAVKNYKNILITGPSRCGKTTLAKCLSKIIKEDSYHNENNFFYFNCGSSQDSRAMLVGNLFLSKDRGTYFVESPFVKAIQTPNSIILLDEITRISFDALNILIPILDKTQRYIRLDEAESSPIINVNNKVCFVATANIGNEYTATKILDKAFLLRFPVKIEMDFLNEHEILNLIKIKFKNESILSLKKSDINNLIKIYSHIVNEFKKPDSKISNFISADLVIEIVEMLLSGFTFEEVIDLVILKEFSDDTGIDNSERIFIKQLIQGIVG